ncbi:MAG: ribosomal-processing cysteine protease Prp [Spirochaetota bacterium]
MIEVKIRIRDKDFESLSIKGHGGDLKGKDIVCAAVSAVAQTALGGLLHYGQRYIHWKMESGILFIKIKKGTTGDVRNSFNVILTATSIALKQIADEYPSRVTVSITNRSNFNFQEK